MARIPYATLIATLMCLLGVGIFCGTMYRGASLTVIMVDQVFHLRLIWQVKCSFNLTKCKREINKNISFNYMNRQNENNKNFTPNRIEAVQMIFVTIAAAMAALGFMILFVGFLATGATRYKVYRAWRSRVGGRISCAVVGGKTCALV